MTVSSFAGSNVGTNSLPWRAVLQDPVQRVLNHVALVAKQAVDSTLTEIRLFSSLDDEHPLVVSVPSPVEDTVSADSWLPAQANFCRAARETVRVSHPFQPGGLLGQREPGWAATGGEQDVLCVVEEVYGSHWFLLSFARSADMGSFSESHRRIIEELAPAIAEQIAEVVAPVNERVGRRISQLSAEYGLTDAESKVAAFLVGTTLSEQAIAAELHRSFNTIHRHVTNIYRKLNVRSRLEAMALLEDPGSTNVPIAGPGLLTNGSNGSATNGAYG
jgi:DNA-binding CsgD family transcriptional regulator